VSIFFCYCSIGVNVDGSNASSVVDNLVFNAGMFEGCYTGLKVGDNTSRNIKFDGTTFPGNNGMNRGVVGN